MGKLEGPILLFLLVAARSQLFLAAQEKEQGGRPLTATLTGAAEIPGPRDPDGAGTFKVELNPGQNQICYELAVSNIATPTAAHIHVGAAAKAGPVVVTLKTAVDGPSKECAGWGARLYAVATLRGLRQIQLTMNLIRGS